MNNNEISCDLSSVADNDVQNIQKLTDQQKKTIWEWAKYLGKALLTAILTKLLGKV